MHLGVEEGEVDLGVEEGGRIAVIAPIGGDRNYAGESIIMVCLD